MMCPLNVTLKLNRFVNVTSSFNIRGEYFKARYFSIPLECCFLPINRPFPSSPEPLFQNEGRCSAFDMEIIFHSHANKTHFHRKGCAPSLILKVRVFGTWKWPIDWLLCATTYCLQLNRSLQARPAVSNLTILISCYVVGWFRWTLNHSVLYSVVKGPSAIVLHVLEDKVAQRMLGFGKPIDHDEFWNQ